MSPDRFRFLATAALLLFGACSGGSGPGRVTGAAGTSASGAAGSPSGAAGDTGTAGSSPGAGGFESFIKIYGFHVFAPKTDTNLTGGQVPQMYKTILQTDPTNHEANRQVADARMELWDGKDRVSWYTPPTSIVDQTIGAI